MAYQFIWVPSYGSSVTVKPHVTATKFGDGYEMRVGWGLNTNPRKWQVTFANRPKATADDIEAFFGARAAVQSFDWMPPHGKAGKWVCREWSAQPTGPFTRTVTATFEEVFEF